jgi:DNA-binding NarL/FixJ family response regulator
MQSPQRRTDTLVTARSDALRHITERERDVLEALRGRRTNREIAHQLVIGIRTVETHVSSLLHQLWADDRRELEQIAFDLDPGRVARRPVAGVR